MTRVGIEGVVVKGDLEVSSSEVAVSTSFSSWVRKEGSPFVSGKGRDDGLTRRLVPFVCRLEDATDAAADDGPGASRTRRVRGRFNFRSGSFGASGLSAGDAVIDLDLRFRFPGLVVSSSFAFSKAPQARVASGVSTGVGSRSTGAALRKTSLAPCRLAILSRCCHCWNSLCSSAVRR